MAVHPLWLLLLLMGSTVTIIKQVKRHILLPHPRPVRLRASLLVPLKASTFQLLTQGLQMCLNPSLSILHSSLLALHLQLQLQRLILSHLENLLLLLPSMATMRPYLPRQTAPKAPMGLPQLHRGLAEVRVKQRIHHRVVIHQQGLKDTQMLKSNTSLSPALEAMKDNIPDTGRETDNTLTGAETGRDITGTGVRSERVTVIVTGTDGTTEITIIATGIACLLVIVPTETGSLSVAGSGSHTTRGRLIATGALTITTTTAQERTLDVSGGDTVIPTALSLIVAGSGSRRVENPDR